MPGQTAKTAVEVPFEFVHNQIVVEVKIGGRGPFNMLIDTDTDPSAIDAAAAKDLGLQVGSRGGAASGGGTETNTIYPTRLPSIEIGAVSALHQRILCTHGYSANLADGLRNFLTICLISRQRSPAFAVPVSPFWSRPLVQSRRGVGLLASLVVAFSVTSTTALAQDAVSVKADSLLPAPTGGLQPAPARQSSTLTLVTSEAVDRLRTDQLEAGVPIGESLLLRSASSLTPRVISSTK